ncbi:patatin family protein [Propioniciclava coleopterorum]|uniref:Patatin family protein n=1 Tax=Propioniciclava coleopterorum TaxID=2714937 RepID=A0A6G7Y7E5_9ACTN|nr:patatin family protein [Propioniciclava coleopterorum]
MPVPPAVNVPDVALIFEGGGMRAAHTSAVVVRLLEAGLVFPFVAGISAGASHTANYLAGDGPRAKASFTSFAADPRFGGLRSFARGRGYFNAEYIYQHTSGPQEALPYAFDRFRDHPAQLSLTAFRCRDGATVRWGRDDIHRMRDLMVRVQASSTMPVLMPPVDIDGDLHVDGALGETGGIPLDAARAAGFRRFFVVLTQERSYVKRPLKYPRFYRSHFRRYPAVADALLSRHTRYNATREELFDLERSGDAYLFVPQDMRIANSERDVAKLEAAHARGLAQARAELPAWRDFLGR